MFQSFRRNDEGCEQATAARTQDPADLGNIMFEIPRQHMGKYRRQEDEIERTICEGENILRCPYVPAGVVVLVVNVRMKKTKSGVAGSNLRLAPLNAMLDNVEAVITSGSHVLS